MGTAVAMDLGIKQVFVLALLNPAEVFKIASVLVLSPRFEILGPVGVYAVRTFGREGVIYHAPLRHGAMDNHTVRICIYNFQHIQEGRIMKYMLILLVLMGLTACRDKIDTGPHAVHYGEDVCERCRMIISDKRFAAQFITESGEAKKYDDIGCMMDGLKDARGRGEVLAIYITDYNTGEWIEAERLFISRTAELKTPMGYDIAAFGNEESMTGEPIL